MAELHTNRKVITEVRLVRKDGEIRWVRSYGHPLWDEKNNRLAGIYGAVQDITDSKQVEKNLHQREAILEIVSNAANLFLKVPSLTTEIWHAEVNNLLERLGHAIRASHAYVFENHLSSDNSVLMNMKYEWTAPGFTSDLENPKYKDLPLETDYMENWNNNVNRGLPYIGDAKHAAPEDMQDLAALGIFALLDVPIYIDNIWWGTIGLDNMAVAREWSNAEVDGLVIAANLLGAAIKRQQVDALLQNELHQRKTLIDELEIKNTESETLRESVVIVAATLERSESIQRILEQLKRVVAYDSASVWLYVENKAVMVGWNELPFGAVGPGEYVLNDAQPDYAFWTQDAEYILLDDVQENYAAFREPSLNYIHGWMAVPLRARGKLTGFISLDSRISGKYTEHDAKLALTYANQVSIALENARLFTELQVELSVRQKLIEELESKNAELERFTYTVSHDLRSPLVTIRGFLGYMERNASQGNMEGFHKDMQRVSAATDRMDNLLRDVLELSRIGRLVNKPQEMPFEDLAYEAVEIVHGRIQGYGITVEVQPGLPAVYGDRRRLIEVLQNLLDNSAKYMGDQKNPLIRIGSSGYDSTNHPIFFVRDNGMGIDAQYHDRIFGMFDKLDPASEGTGIGLALVKRIIEFHGGRIWVESEKGKGTTFYFTLAGNTEFK